MKKLLLHISLTLLVSIYPFTGIFSQAFTEETGILLIGTTQSSVTWGDYDNDNDLDILLTGYSSSGDISLVYRNDGGIFTNIIAGLPGIYNGSCKWGDYDNDGDLDILIAGSSMARIYRNDGGLFTDISAGLTGVSNAATDWGDYDNDGDLDILISGSTPNYITKIYANENGIFSDINADLPGVNDGTVLFSDFDKDGDLDVFLAGNMGSVYLTRIYRNDNGNFKDMNAIFPAFLYSPSASTGDYDNDGDVDIAIAGYISGAGAATKVFRNDNGIFVDINANIAGVESASVAFGDYDNDGYLDLFVSGYPNSSRIYRNNNGIFTDINAGFTGVESGGAAWADFNNDSRLDIIISGYSSSGYITKIYRNNVSAPNAVPGTPNSLTSSVTSAGMTLTWNGSTDGLQTPASAMSYNIYIGTTPGAVNRKSPMSNITTGYRKIVQKGNILSNTYTIKRLPAGTYYWSVQAIDNQFSGSAFATSASFIVPFSSTIAPVGDQNLIINQNSAALTVTESSAPTSRQWKYSITSGGPYDQIITGATGLTCSPSFAATGVYYVVCESVKSGVTYISNQVKITVSDFQAAGTLTGINNSSMAWGDFDNDGDLDLLMAGYTGLTNITSIYRNDLGVLTDITAGLPGVTGGSVGWGDYDNDGDLDVLLTGANISAIYNNTGGTFMDIYAGLPGINQGFSEWGDYDNDGDLDILLGGSTSTGNISKIFLNNSNVFTDASANLFSSANSFASSGDYDNDGDLDILFISSNVSKIYRNDSGSFSDINTTIQATTYPSAAWGDYDNDGDLDILIAGSGYSRVFQNDNGNFTDIIANLPTLSYPSAAWGDYDNDGDLDILLAGSGTTGIYKNTGGIFSQIVTTMTGINDGSSIWGDYDNDGDLDITLTGKNANNNYVTLLYKNNISSTLINSAPSAPANLQYVTGPNTVTLSWDPSADSSTPARSLSYNVYIGTSPGGINKRSPHSSMPGGYRKIVQKTSQSLSLKVKNLPSGTYYWGVQAIDNSFAGSVFSAERSFTVTYSTSVNQSSEQTIKINQNGTVLAVTESSPANSRQWKYSSSAGGPYTNTITGANGTNYTPFFTDWGTYFVVCESMKDGIAYTSNEVRINIPVFSEYTGTGIYPVSSRSVTWGDYDNDGDLDILSSSNGTRIFRNDITGFQEILLEFYYKQSNSSRWGDYDNDGDLDILLSGYYSGIYRNDGAVFTEVITGFTGGVSYGNCAWFDYDLDGDLDVIFSGTYATKIYRNDNSFFTEISSNMIGGNNNSFDIGDYDNDGDPDVLIVGYNYLSIPFSVIYQNNKSTFTNIHASLPLMTSYSSATWGDYDNDGDLDIVFAGNGIQGTTNSSGPLAKIFRNDNGIFADINANLTAVTYGNTLWGDYDNDGDLDLLISGQNSAGILMTKIYRNDNSVFIDINAGLAGVRMSSAAWGDYDNDKDIDILLAGIGADGYSNFKLFSNNITVQNSKPSAPSGLVVTNNGKMNFSWNKSTDSRTPQNGLSYNIYIGSVSVTGNKRSPMASIPGGYRKISARGPEQKNSLSIKNLPAGNYYWGVQAIDHTFAGSDFSGEIMLNVPFSVTVSPLTEQTILPGGTGNILTVIESGIPSSRQWKYSTSPGGTYTSITSKIDPTYTPVPADFPGLGTYYVVCQSVSGSVTYTTDEVKIRVRAFSENSGPNGLIYCSVSYGDYDNDGDLDELATGRSYSTYYNTILFRRDPGGMTMTDPGMVPVIYGSTDWGDYDNDGDLDVLLTGTSSTERISKIYRNDAGVFTNVVNLSGVSSGAGTWGDYDNDGDLDILLTGSGFADIFRNDAGAFSQVNAGLPGISNSSSSWVDYDKDSDLDVFLAGVEGTNVISKLFRNDNGLFTDLNAGFTGVNSGSHAWGDFDNDGDPDLILNGLPSSSMYGGVLPFTSIYQNNGGTFSDVNAGLPGAFRGSVAWGDYDIDGDLDILLTGSSSVDPISKIFRNDNGSFTDINEELQGVQNGGAVWFDYDNDTDLDIAIGGLGTTGFIGTMYENLLINTTLPLTTPNAPPSPPSNLLVTLASNKVTMNWNKSTDSKTAQNGLTYNVYIGTAPGTINKKSPMANIPSGFRKIIKPGSGVNSTFIKNLPAGTYYWSVQAIDNCFIGSTFPAEATFTVSYANSINPVADQTIAVNMEGTTLNISETTPADSRLWKYSMVSGGPYDNVIQGATGTSYTPKFTTWGRYYVVCVSVKSGVSYTSNEVRVNVPLFFEDTGVSIPGAYASLAKWGDYDNDSDLDILFAGSTTSGYVSRIYNNSAGAFTNINATLPQFNQGAGSWGDYDGDGDLDILVAGYTSSGYISKIFKNDAGTFNDINAVLQGVNSASASWGDYDNDGDPDVLLTGFVSSTTFISRIYRNDKTSFKDIHAQLEPVSRGFAEWGDYDNDGDKDILLSGQGVGNTSITRIYRNNDGTFVDINATLMQLQRGAGAWGDYDNDGDLDILITGSTGISATSDSYTKIYRNDNGSFTDTNTDINSVQLSSVDWGDFDNDGDLDILLAGNSPSGMITRIFKNDSGIFTNINAGLQGSYYGTVSWGDYDNDGDLDILLTGNSSAYITKVYRNTYTVANTAPSAPANPATVPVDMDKVVLTWDKATDTQSTQNTLSYNVRFGTAAGGNQVLPSMSGASGYRQVPAIGNALFRNTGFPVRNLLPATAYYWSVQAVDQAYKGGPWSAERAFSILPAPVAVRATNLSHTGFTANWTTSAGATGYLIDVATDNAFASMVAGYNSLNAGNVTSFAVTGLSPVTTYYYRVRPYITGANGIFISNIIATTTYPVPPPAPGGLAVSSCNDNVTLTWTAITTPYPFTTYRIYGGTTSDPAILLDSTASGQISVTTKTIGGLAHGQTYYFKVTGVIQPGVAGEFSTVVSAKVKTGVRPLIKAKWGNLLIAYNKGDSISSFQWFNAGNQISGANKQYYVTNKSPGSYYVQSTDKDGCKNNSNAVNIGSKSLSIYPNPASGSFRMTLSCESTGNTLIRIINSSGTRVLEYKTEKIDGELINEFDIHSLQSGIYSVEVIVDNEEKLDTRLVVIK